MDSRRRSRPPARASLSSPGEVARSVKDAALSLGFDLAGVAPAAPTEHTERLREWIGRAYAGSMAYLGERLEEPVDPRRVLEGARSVGPVEGAVRLLEIVPDPRTSAGKAV